MEVESKYKFEEKDKIRFLEVFKNYRHLAHCLNLSLSYTHDILNGKCYISTEKLNEMYAALKKEMRRKIRWKQ